jgi:hypothetical protein
MPTCTDPSSGAAGCSKADIAGLLLLMLTEHLLNQLLAELSKTLPETAIWLIGNTEQK